MDHPCGVDEIITPWNRQEAINASDDTMTSLAMDLVAGNCILKRVGNLPIKHLVLETWQDKVKTHDETYRITIPTVRIVKCFDDESNTWYPIQHYATKQVTRKIPIYAERTYVKYKAPQGRVHTTVLPPTLRVQVA